MSGRAASTKLQIGDLALSVGRPPKATPPGWSWVELNELAEMATGHTPSRMHPEYWGGKIKWMCASDARFQHGGIVDETAETINQKGIENSAAVLLPEDTVCLARTGASIGYAVRLGEPMATNQGFVNWICGRNLSPKFLQYILVAESEFLKRIAYGAAHHTIYFPEVKAFHVCIPPLPEQRRIVGILDEAFAGIATAKVNAERNLQNARALFESHLQAVFTQRGEGWLEKPFSELCDIKHGFTFKSKYFTDQGDYVMLTPGNFYETGGYRDRGEKQKFYCGPIPEGFILEKGDMLVAMTEQAAGLLGSPILIPESNRFLHNQRLGLVIKKPGVPWTNEFFFHVFNTQRVRKEIHDSASGVKVRHTSPTKIGAVIVAFPTSVPQQRAIVSNLNELDEETQRLESLYQRKLAALDELKRSLLHQAFSGEL